MVVTFDKKPEYIDPNYVLVWVPERRHTDSVMTRPVISTSKSRHNMYRKGHYARVKRPSGPELYEDASRILDQLLRKQLNDERGAHGRPRHKTHPLSTYRPITSGEVLDERDEHGLDEGIERCKTMPSAIRRSSKDEKLLPKDKDAVIEKADKRHRPPADLSASSADTEGDSASMSEHRKKKSLFRKTKDIFLHAFHRQEREKEIRLKEKDSPRGSPQTTPKKRQKKAGSKSVSDNKNGALDSQRNKDNPSANSLTSHEDSSVKRRNSSGKTLLNSIRKSMRSKKDDRNNEASSDRTKHTGTASSSGSKERILTPDREYPPPPPASLSSQGGEGQQTTTSLSVPSSDRKGSSVSRHEKSASPFPNSSSTDSRLDNGDKSSSLYSFMSAKHNVLDYPGDDIEYMDMDDSNASSDRVHNGHGYSNSASQGASVTHHSDPHGQLGYREDLRRQQSLCVDGDTDSQDGKKLEGEEEIPLHERTAEEKEEMYGRIAQKLIHIADNFAAESGMSDSETHPREAGASASGVDAGDGVLSELEKQILDCLRNAGDRNNDVIDQPAGQIIEQTTAQTYERFKTTVQHSLGDNVSWNQLAFLFYTTKGVMKSVGKGSKLASDAKEMTLRYFSDKFAKWIMDQGGFDSVLSESDSELD